MRAGDAAIAVVFGVVLAAGILLIATRVPVWSAPSLVRRIAPYVRDVADPQGLTPLVGARAGTGWGAARIVPRRFAAWAGSASVERRLAQSGWSLTPARFRVRQLAAAVGGLMLGGTVVVALALSGAAWVGSALLPPMLAVSGVVFADALLTGAARRRMRRIHDEVPTVLEFLSLCLSAGESLLDALRRVGDVGSGDLTAHVRQVVLATSTGSPLAAALTDMARSLDVASVSRAVDQIVAAIDRGAPLVQVLQAQAIDAREDAKRVLIEQAGRKEILMLLPLVFLVLPLSVLFAVFPGVVMLRLGL